MKGEPVERFERGRVYALEFWAQWCNASRRAVARMSALQRSHPEDLTVVALSSSDVQGESLEKVTAFVSEQSDAIGYRVAFDDRRRTAREWLDEFDVRTVPTVFIVNREGVIAWIGNPLWPPGEMEDAAERVIRGEFTAADREALHRRHLERRQRIAEVEREFDDVDRLGNPARAVRLLDVLIELNPDGAATYALRKFELMMSRAGALDDAYRFGRQALEGPLKNDADRLDSLARIILEDEGLVRRDLDLAFAAARRAVELTRHAKADMLDTLALAHFQKGELERAVEVQKRVIDLTPEETDRSDYLERLRQYERALREKHP